MPEQIISDNWPLGWIASSSLQEDFGAPSQGLLRMDNLTLDEKGSIRLINRPTAQSATLGYQVNSIFAAYINALKLRYLYDSAGNLHRNYNPSGANTLTAYDLLLGSGGNPTNNKCTFLNALGHVIACAGSLQIKDRGDKHWALTIPQPTAPVLTNQSPTSIDLDNLDGSGNYTNWASIVSSAFNNAGTAIVVTGSATFNYAAFQTVYSSVIDTTNFGTTGEDTPQDLFSFNLQITDPTQLQTISINLFCQDPTGGTVTDSFLIILDFIGTASGPGVISAVNNFPVGTPITYSIPRSLFYRFGSNSAVGWNTIKSSRVSIYSATPTACTFKGLGVASGAVQGQLAYVVVELNNTGQFLQWSIASAQVSINASLNSIKVDRSGAACNSQCNEIRTFRHDAALGQFIQVNRQTGAYGFTPAFFIDSLSDQTALANAAVDATQVLNYFRAQLPTNIIGMIYFASRVMYLTVNSFIPSYQLDFGSYDSRFTYELTGTNAELCLFITKLSVGTFIVATTVDFYQINGDFSLQTTTLPDGTTTTIQNVVIQPLGVSDPAISSRFFEVEGNIFYMSARGLRSMVNGVSTLLNSTTDLLFRDEARYGFPAVDLATNDLSNIGMVTSGNRLYLALPFTNGQNAIFVNTYGPPLPSELRGSNYWRPIIQNALCLCKELDGTVLGADNLGNVFSLEDSFTGTSIFYFLSQYSYGQKPSQSKALGTFLLSINTGGSDVTLTINGLHEDGSVVTFTKIINAATTTLVYVDPQGTLDNCVAFQYSLGGTVSAFELNYAIYIVIFEYPPKTFYEILPATNFNTDKTKQLSKWSFRVDTLGNPITVKVTADGVVLSTQTYTPFGYPGIETVSWYNLNNVIATTWQIEVASALGMHFFEFLSPDILNEYPSLTYYALLPFTNLGKDTLKKVSKWGFVIDTLGHEVTSRVTADNAIIDSTINESPEPQGISTEFWYNQQDIAALDWQIEVIAPSGMRFYKFMPPDILQIYPPGRMLDLVGPLDIDLQGIVYGFRIRLINEGVTFHYDVYDNDVVVYSNDVYTTTNEDSTYIEKFPKGVNTSVIRIELTAATLFYRFSLELEIRSTGKETEQRWIKIGAK